MISVYDGWDRTCQGYSRREFLRVGALGLSGLTLPGLLAAKARGAAVGANLVKDRSVVLLFLGGGPSHIETFDPKMEAPVEIRSVTGEVRTTLPGVTFGGTFPRLARLAHKLAVVRNLAHHGADHNDGIRVMMSGVPQELHFRPREQQNQDAWMPEMVARIRGTTHPRTSMPTSVVVGPTAISSDKGFRKDHDEEGRGTGALGQAYMSLNPAGKGELIKDMKLQLPRGRFDDRRALLARFDGLRREVDASGVMEGMDRFQQQAADVLLGGIAGAFDWAREDPATIAAYDTSAYTQLPPKLFKRESALPTQLGKQMLLARRLVEAGAGFVTVRCYGWDMHGNNDTAPTVPNMMPPLGGAVDKAAAAFIEDCERRGLADRVLLLITGEFGRTPGLDKNGGRDHWCKLTPLVFYGGGLRTGQVIGRSDRRAYGPAGDACTPQQMMATIMHTLFDLGELRVTIGLPDEVVRRVTALSPIEELV